MSPVKQTRGLEALLCACGELRPDRVAALLPSIEPDVCYDVSYGSATEYVHRFQKLVELLVLMSSNNTLPGFKDASEDDRVLEVIARRASQDPDDVVICTGEQTPEERTAAARARAEREGTVVDVDDESAPKRARGQ